MRGFEPKAQDQVTKTGIKPPYYSTATYPCTFKSCLTDYISICKIKRGVRKSYISGKIYSTGNLGRRPDFLMEQGGKDIEIHWRGWKSGESHAPMKC